jgi:hypothetical protein
MTSADQPVQQWDYDAISWTLDDLDALRDGVNKKAKEWGQSGWEMVNASLTHTQVGSKKDGPYAKGILYFQYSIICWFKRPISQ